MTRGIQIPTIPHPRTNPKIADSGRRTRYMPLRDVIKGNRVSPAPRRAPSIAKKTPTAGGLDAWVPVDVTPPGEPTRRPVEGRGVRCREKQNPIGRPPSPATEELHC